MFHRSPRFAYFGLSAVAVMAAINIDSCAGIEGLPGDVSIDNGSGSITAPPRAQEGESVTADLDAISIGDGKTCPKRVVWQAVNGANEVRKLAAGPLASTGGTPCRSQRASIKAVIAERGSVFKPEGENFIIRATVFDERGQSANAERIIFLTKPGTTATPTPTPTPTPAPGGSANRAPVAQILLDQDPPVAGFGLRYEARLSTDPDGDADIVKYEWDTDGDGTYDADGHTIDKSPAFTDPGTKTVKLRVVDSKGAVNEVSKTVTVAPNSAPFAFFSTSPPTPFRGSTFILDAPSNPGETLRLEAPGYDQTITPTQGGGLDQFLGVPAGTGPFVRVKLTYTTPSGTAVSERLVDTQAPARSGASPKAGAAASKAVKVTASGKPKLKITSYGTLADGAEGVLLRGVVMSGTGKYRFTGKKAPKGLRQVRSAQMAAKVDAQRIPGATGALSTAGRGVLVLRSTTQPKTAVCLQVSFDERPGKEKANTAKVLAATGALKGLTGSGTTNATGSRLALSLKTGGKAKAFTSACKTAAKALPKVKKTKR